MWRNPESVIQSEVSQKNKYAIWTHICGILGYLGSWLQLCRIHFFKSQCCSAQPHCLPRGLLGLILAHASPSCQPLSWPRWGLWLPDRRTTEGRIQNSQLAPTGRISEFPPALKLCLHTALGIHWLCPIPGFASCYLSFVALKSPFPWFWSEAAVLRWQPAIPDNGSDIYPWLSLHSHQKPGSQSRNEATAPLTVSQRRWAVGSQWLSFHTTYQLWFHTLPRCRCVFW